VRAGSAAPGAPPTYTLREVLALLGLSRWMVRGLVAEGFVRPERGPRGEYRFSFQDLVLLRTAVALRGARIAPRRILRTLARLREQLPSALPLTGLRIAAVGNEVVVRDGSAPWAPESGQLVLDFELPAAAPVRTLAAPSPVPCSGAAAPRAPTPAPASAPAQTRAPGTDWFLHAVQLEARDPKAAMAAYRRAIAEHPGRSDAVLNLGVMLGAAGRHRDAVALYRAAIERLPGEALLHFNLGVALEDAGDADAALATYARCLVLDAAMADAHFNAARLFDRSGRKKEAIRHYSAYKRLTRPGA
jgi:tetratricopeptide (TPR) repeat protein